MSATTMAAPRQRGMSRLEWRDAVAGYLLIAPNLVLYLAFVVFPVVFSLVLSFTEWSFLSGLKGLKYVGLANFAALPGDQWFTQSLRNNLVYMLIVPISMAIALLLALILNRAAYGRPLLRTMIFMPYISSTVAVAVVWLVIFHPTYGPLNAFLMSLGIAEPPKWTASLTWALPAVMIVSVWAALGYDMVLYLAGLQAIPSELYEAAEIDGASRWQQFRHITLPLLSPTTFFLLVTGIISSFRAFALIQVMTQGGPGTATTLLAYYIYKLGFQFYRMGYASAVAWVLLVIVFVFTLIQFRGQRRFTFFLG